MQQIGRIVKCTGHVDYVCRVHAPADVAAPPGAAEYAFGAFVGVELAAGAGYLVGLIRDTALLNPEFGRRGPRPSPPADLEAFSPDYLSERAVLVSVVAVGQVGADGSVRQRIPPPAAGLGAGVARLSEGQIRAFHRGAGGRLQVAYAPFLLAREEPLAAYLLLGVIERLAGLFPDQARQLAVLRGNLAWKAAVLPAG